MKYSPTRESRRPTPLTTSTNGTHPGIDPSEKGLLVRLVLVTPSMAAEWLTRNTANRPKKQTGIAQYRRDMAAGQWPVTGQTVIWDRNDVLRDGQNRLTACVESGAPFWTLVVWGIDPDAFAYIDRGAKRSIADVLALQGRTAANALAAACQYVWRDEHGVSLAQGGKSTATIAEVFDILSRHPDLADSLQWRNNAQRVGYVPALAVYLHWRLSQLDSEAATYFFGALFSAEGLSSPIATLTRQLRPPDGRLPVPFQAAYTIKSWNAWGSYKELKLLKWNPKLEAFPSPVAPSLWRSWQ